jgi:hypothetical protein
MTKVKMNNQKLFSDILHKILNNLDTFSDSELKTFISEFRKFRSGETIQDYEDWLNNLVQERTKLKNHQTYSILKELTGLIENLSYGATEDFHIDRIKTVQKSLKREKS